VTSFAVTADGRRVVSASKDRTLKVWDLATSACLATHRGDAAFTIIVTTATAICAADVGGAMWFLDGPPLAQRPLASSPHAIATPISSSVAPPAPER
jgi:WD40 repeat protein